MVSVCGPLPASSITRVALFVLLLFLEVWVLGVNRGLVSVLVRSRVSSAAGLGAGRQRGEYRGR